MSLTEVGSQDLARMDGQQALPGDLPVPAFLVLGLQVHDIVSGFSSQRVVAQRRYRGLNFSSCAYIASSLPTETPSWAEPQLLKVAHFTHGPASSWLPLSF